MTLFRFPVLVWRDLEGLYNASVVEWAPDSIGVDTKPSGALKQIKRWLEWRVELYASVMEPDFLEPRLQQVDVTVRPRYREEDRVFPSEEQIELRVVCVLGRQASGMLCCSLPMFGLVFYYYQESSLKRLVVERVRSQLAECTPAEVASYLPPAEFHLDQVSVRGPGKAASAMPEQRNKSLQQVAEPLGRTDVKKRFTPAWQREEELRDLVQRLSQERVNVLLLGEHGVGKTTLLAAAVRTLERKADAKEHRQENRPRLRHWLTSGPRLIAGMKYLGQWEQRCEEIIAELSSFDGVLCVESLLDLVRHGGREASDSIAAFFLPFLASGELRMTAEATPSELDACRRLLPGFADLFQTLRLHSMPPDRVRQALQQMSESESRNLKIEVQEGAIETVSRLFQRFIPYQALPGKAAPFLTNLMSQAKQEEQKQVDPAAVLDEFVRQTGLPELFLRDDLLLKTDELLAEFEAEVIGQTAACRAASQLTAAFKAGLNDPQRPVGVLLFCGPTGVGKTEMAKTLSRYLFGHGAQGDRLIRLDMSEYSGWDAADRLITKPDRTPSEFLHKVRAQPFVVVLLDEIEKAHPDVFDLLIGLLDEGRLTDRFGRTTSFCSAIIIMTSNLGVSRTGAIGFDSSGSDAFEKEVRTFFRPEFFNRIDEVVPFEPLRREDCRLIVEKQLRDLSQREGLAAKRLQLRWTEQVVDLLTETGFDPRYGARPLQRELEVRVTAPLSRFLVGQRDSAATELELRVVDQQVQVRWC
ncbi:AAA family ATPase [Lignipirellula cremea]|uniref:ATP-dependent Clp protease ATP-binding subunit ClpC n=1 Tax=Lignipirellula cremea TaxID=2528010 RepID=A0A518DX63_9BACT|nr:AAA family ATPase [Lignipirellula cremea]QDU96425.1 ATP-dependent Clp protease ATP-binding subunit ClpC [Lignipirellula cremea]